ncbi:MAG TPA: hypothetical protein VI547_05730, partial [Anaerolineales bacterium]|nr:hypothetical protein [Anaerolineales bacterium]
MPKHSISTLLRITGVYAWPGGLALSPKGNLAAVNWNKGGTWDIWLVSLSGGKPQKITGGSQSKGAPRFSPDGTKLGYLQDYDGDEKYDLHIYDLKDETTRNVMPDTDDALNDHFSWSPDSRHAAFVSNRGGRFAVHVLDTVTGFVRRVSEHTYSDYVCAWSPDGMHIAFSAQISGQTSHIFIAPASGGATRTVADKRGPMDAHSPRWSPD